MKFDQHERTALKRAGFAIADDHEAAYLNSLVVIGAHDDETFWLTVHLAEPHPDRLRAAATRDHRRNRGGRLTRRTEGGRSNIEDIRGLLSGRPSRRGG